MRRSAVALLPCLLLTATGLTLVGLAAAVSAPPPAPVAAGTHASADAALVRRFYEVANDALRTGDSAPLDLVLAPSFVAHGIVPDADTDLAGFQRYLVALHSAYPALRLTVEDLVADQAAVVTRVAIQGGDRGTFAGAAIAGSAAPWGTVDSFRIRNGQIVELWASAGTFPETLFRARVPDLPAGATTIALDRLRLAEGIGGVAPVDRWPRLVWIEKGSVTLSVVTTDASEAAGQLVAITRATASPSDAPDTIPPGESAIARSGDVAVIPGGVAYDLSAVGAEIAVALGVSMHPSWPARSVDVIIDSRRGDAAALDAPPPLSGWPLGAAVEHVGSWTVARDPDGPVFLEAGRLRLSPGAELTMGQAAGPIMFAVEAGALELKVEQGTVSIQQPGTTEHPTDGTDLPDQTPQTVTLHSQQGSATVGGGGDVLLPTGMTVRLSAADAAPVTCLVLALLPERG